MSVSMNKPDSARALSKSFLFAIGSIAILGTASHSAQPVNPNATPQARALLAFLEDTFGNKVLSGQATNRGPSNGNKDLDYIKDRTDKEPAILGIDVMIYGANKYGDSYRRQLDNVYKDAKAWWDKGGIVSLHWHWSDPRSGTGSYDKTKVNIDIKEALREGSDLNDDIKRDMDVVAGILKKLQADGVPILWRPLHEICGGWFWWTSEPEGAGSVALWRYLYDYLTDHHGLNNLLWVYSASQMLRDNQEDWYPGHDYVDISGVDVYTKDNSDVLEKFWRKLESHSGDKPLALSENGAIPDPDKLKAAEIPWLWFLVWHGEWLRSSEWNTTEQLRKAYRHDFVLTLDELPDLKAYRIDNATGLRKTLPGKSTQEWWATGYGARIESGAGFLVRRAHGPEVISLDGRMMTPKGL